ncbi:MAG TPA: FHA domain-containing protein, partial [Stellaceae bacterium]|nr:FHA domain-containing protein [Stellaceae bacterium]
MPLILTLTDQEDQTRRETRTLSQGSLSIGRNPDNFPGLDRWILEDTTRQVSKTHCMISAEAGSYVLEDRSTNGIYINGSQTPTSNGSRIVLNDGDQLRLGRYLIAVQDGKISAGPDPFGLDAPAAPVRIDAFGGTGTGMPDPLGVDPLDDIFGGGGHAPPPYIQPAARAPQPFRAEDPFDLASEGRRERIDSDDDLFRPRPATETWQGGS